MLFYFLFYIYKIMTNIYYQKNKEKLQKETQERYQNLYEKEKKRSVNMAKNDIRTS